MFSFYYCEIQYTTIRSIYKLDIYYRVILKVLFSELRIPLRFDRVFARELLKLMDPDIE
jgi:hypothetical protein